MKKILYILSTFVLMSTTSCIDEMTPTSVVSSEQVQKMSSVQESMLWGISAYMVTFNSWNSSDYLNDWGYPCQMYFRELCGADFPVSKSTYDYWTYYENCSYTSSYPYYTWNYYYRLVKNANNLIGAIDPSTKNTESRHYLGSALAFRALAYLDLARQFEFKPTGYETLDFKAEQNGIWGLTVPIVTEKTSNQDVLQNPRVDFCTMYRFIMNDLRNAEDLLSGYDYSDKSLPGIHAVYGLLARAYMEIGSRYEETMPQLADYASKMAESNQQQDGFGTISELTAKACYEQAAICAEKAMQGYDYVTKDQWQSKTTGFNTANQGWIWRMRIGGKEQLPTYYCSFLGQTATEPASGLARYGGAYRCISSQLYEKISSYDWRKTSWLAPTDAGKKSPLIVNKYQSLLPDSILAQVPAYANFKFRPGNGNIDDYNEWLISDLPVMRMEEMQFIKAEAKARTEGYESGLNELKTFVSHRFTNLANYKPEVTDLESFLEELMTQKRIEFWGEGICFFDYKRLNLQVDRTLSSNIEDAFKIKSKRNYCCPWLNFFIMQYETNRNAQCIANPDVSGYYDTAE